MGIGTKNMMPRRTARLCTAAVALLLVSFAVACGSNNQPIVQDGGPTGQDGGAVTQDGGTVAQDGGTVAQDGGTVTQDGGTVTQDGGTVTQDGGDSTAPTVLSTTPANGANGIALNRGISATFSEAMNDATITVATFTLKQGATLVAAAVTYAGNVATLKPTSNLSTSTAYTATITTGAQDLAANGLAADRTWTFTTGTATQAGPAPVDLGTAGNFAILAKSGIDSVPTSAVTGDIGVSPIDSTAITGFSLTLDSSGTFSTSAQLVGKARGADYTSPTPSMLTTAVGDMETAFTSAAGRPGPDFTELGAGDISGLTLVPGLYKWGTGILISTDVTLSGGPDDVWIFQIGGGITQASGAKILLAGGALPKNIFWQTFGAVALDTAAHLEGVVLSKTEITLATGATVNGRLLTQTAVTLDQSTVVQPAP